MFQSTGRQLLEPSKTTGKKVLILFAHLNLMMNPQPKKYKTNRGVISAVGLRRIILAKAVSDARERMQEEYYHNTIQKGFRR